jgi:predicted DCC family thiol-disulfide oxidoreductase YuxK
MSWEAGRWTVVFDGECGMCTRSVERLRAWDTEERFETVSYQAPEVVGRFPQISLREFQESVQLIGPTGQRWEGADAVARILDLLPRTQPLSRIFDIPLVRPVARLVYRWIARNRGRLGCGDHCPVEET